MEVRKGYKQTEIGMFPNDWNIKTCSEISDLITVGIVIRPTQYYVKHGVPALRSANVREDGLNDLDLVFISEKSNSLLSKSQVREGDLVTVRTGYPGTTAVVSSSFAGSNCVDLLIMRPSKNINSSFLAYWINSSHGKDQVLRNQGGLAQQHFNVGDLRNLFVAIPSLPEQKAIAAALNDVDALLTSLDALIAKKRLIKQGAMQELLTGKKRLPGFGGEWEIVKFDDLADKNVKWSITGGPFGSNLKASDYVPDGVRIIQLQNIGDGVFHDDYAIYTSEQKANELISCNIYPGEIILSKMGDPVARACLVPMKAKRYLMASDGIRLVVDAKRFDKRFVFYYINSIYFRRKAIEASTGSTRQRIGLTDLRNLPFIAPSLPEQTAIAEILSDMDADIAALEARREKTRLLKQGMMQELLTGRIRLA